MSDTIIKHNEQYNNRANKQRKRVVYKEDDLVWIHLRKERFPASGFGKLQPRADGPFRVIKRINDNAYKIELPGHYNVSATFNVADLSPYVGDQDDDMDSGASVFRGREDDVGASDKWSPLGWISRFLSMFICFPFILNYVFNNRFCLGNYIPTQNLVPMN